MNHSKEPVTLKILADLLGLTPSTISKALRDSSDISEKTRNMVKKKARELGYQPNIMAQSLIKRRTHILGVIVPDLRVSFFSEVARGIYDQAESMGYEAIVMVHDESVKVERRNLEFFSALNVDGILISAVPGNKNLKVIKQIIDRGIPFVCYDRIIEGLNLQSVTIDDEAAACKLMNHFIVQKKRKKILFVGPTRNLFVARGRYAGYRKSLEQNDIPYHSEYTLSCKINEMDAYQKIKQLIEKGLQFDAVMCVGGLVAYGVGRAILDAGLRIPEDVLLAEFGENHVVYRLGVPFVTVNQFPYRMGQQATRMIVDSIEHGDTSHMENKIVMDTKLIFHKPTKLITKNQMVSEMP